MKCHLTGWLFKIKKKKLHQGLRQRQTFQDKILLAKAILLFSLALSEGMVKLYFLLLLGQVSLKAGRCNKNSIWLFALHHGPGVYRKQGASTKSQNHSVCGWEVGLCLHKLFSSIRVWSSIWCISRFSSLACDSFSVRKLKWIRLISHKQTQVRQ